MNIAEPGLVIIFTQTGRFDLVLDASSKLISPEIINVCFGVIVEVGVHSPLGIRE